MDDLRMIRDLLDEPPPPSPHVIADARARLDRLTARPARPAWRLARPAALAQSARPVRSARAPGGRLVIGLTAAAATVALLALALPALLGTNQAPTGLLGLQRQTSNVAEPSL